MASTWTQLKRTLGIALPASAAVLAIASGAALAATSIIETCPDVAIDPNLLPMAPFPGYMPTTQANTCKSTYGGCFRFDGSDTLTQVAQQAVVASGACLSYHNIGSGQGEKNIANLSGIQTIQGIAPMSRNFVPSVTPPAPVTVKNVVALDAPVVTFQNLGTTTCGDIAPGYVTGDQSTAPLNSNLSIILSGYPSGGLTVKSKGTTAECADPRRLAAVQALADCQNVDQILHILRRDDKSGTQDTFREHLQFDYWCNGNSPGNVNKSDSNTKNEDLDPIRRPCVGSDSTKAYTKCTYYPTGQQCSATDTGTITDPVYGTLSCTQGLIVAISQNDPGANDITVSIGRRVGLDLTRRTVGLAGLASHDPSNLKSQGATINSNTFEPDNIRLKSYMFARRLFIMGPVTTSDANRNIEEGKFFTYATTNCGMDILPDPYTAIVPAAGFLIPQASTCGNSPCTDTSGNPLACGVPEFGAGMAAQYIAYGKTCTSSNPCATTGATCSSGTCPGLPSALVAGSACNASQGQCGGTGNHCTGSNAVSTICQ